MSEAEYVEEPQAPEPQEEAPALTELQEFAVSQGWQVGGEKSATEWLAANNNIRKGLEKTVNDLRAQQDAFQKALAEKMEADHKVQQETLGQQLDRAIEDGDAAEARRITAMLQQPAPQPPPAAVEEQVDVEAVRAQWLQQNPWYYTDAKRANMANTVFNAEIGAGNQDIFSIFQKVDATVAEWSTPPKNENREQDPPSQAGGRKRQTSGLSRNDLTETERRHFDQYVSSGLSEANLLKSIQKQRDARR